MSEIFCATTPDVYEISFTQDIALERKDGGSLSEADLVILENCLRTVDNSAKLSLFDPCDAEYRQIPNVEADRSILARVRHSMVAKETTGSVSTNESEHASVSRSLRAYSVTFVGSGLCQKDNPCTVEVFLDTDEAII
jgi:hypothetical protein